jgi:hypothetical protein
VSETDRYGWLLRYVYVGGTFVNAALVRNGYALAATFPPDAAHAAFFATLQAEAQAEGAGLWSGCPTPTPQPTAAPSVCLCSRDICNCSDFKTPVEAQACFDHCLAQVGTDVHRLASAGDGVAWEGPP